MKSNTIKRLFLFVIASCLYFVAFLPRANSVVDLDEAAVQYTNLCESCHGSSGENRFPNKNSYTSASGLIDIYDSIGVHDDISPCDTDCVENTNTYIWETLWGNGLSAAEIYMLKCAHCHGALAQDYFPNKDIFTSEAELISAYADVSAHAHVETCGVTCIETTNAYVWNSLWDNADPENTGCFIGSLKR